MLSRELSQLVKNAVVMPAHARGKGAPLSRSNLSLLLVWVWPLAGSPSTSVQRPVARRFRPAAGARGTYRTRPKLAVFPSREPGGSVAVAQCQWMFGPGVEDGVAAEIDMKGGGRLGY
jgi:hypothetical protein